MIYMLGHSNLHHYMMPHILEGNTLHCGQSLPHKSTHSNGLGVDKTPHRDKQCIPCPCEGKQFHSILSLTLNKTPHRRKQCMACSKQCKWIHSIGNLIRNTTRLRHHWHMSTTVDCTCTWTRAGSGVRRVAVNIGPYGSTIQGFVERNNVI
jgi:hypothetical protein